MTTETTALPPTDGRIEVAAWYADHPSYTIGGSLYALPHRFRPAAAAALTACRCRVHADIIIAADGTHRGVTWTELATIRDQVPTARLDLHLISLNGPRPDDERKALHSAAELAADAISLTVDVINRHRHRLELLRSGGVQVWAEVSPAQAPGDIPADQIDGSLVMLIEPGTKNTADLAQLDKIDILARHLSVGVDGGVTRQIAPDCRHHGATYVVSGRDLLRVASPDQPTKPAAKDPSTKGSRP